MTENNKLPEELTDKEKVAEVKKQIEQEIAAIKKQSAEIDAFKQEANDALKELYTTTKPEIIQKVNSDFINAIAEMNATIVEVGREYRSQMNEAFQNILKMIPVDKIIDINTRNSYTAILLSLYAPVKEFLVSDEKRAEALMHVNIINAVLRSLKVRYNGCKAQWDAEDKAVEDARKAFLAKAED